MMTERSIEELTRDELVEKVKELQDIIVKGKLLEPKPASEMMKDDVDIIMDNKMTPFAQFFAATRKASTMKLTVREGMVVSFAAI